MSEPKWLTLARKDIGVHEGTDAKPNPVVLKMFADAGHPEIPNDHRTPWCAAAVGAWLKRSGVKPTGSLAAVSYETYGTKLNTPILGCIGVKRRSAGAEASWQRHVGFVVAANAVFVWMVGGNTSDAVEIAAYPRAQFTAFRWPPVAVPKDLSRLPTDADGAKGPVSET